MIGTLGDIVFEVSDRQILTFSGLSRNVGAKYQTHSRVGQSPILEFTGEDVETISLSVKLSAFLGTDPERTADQINEACRSGTAMRLILGKKRIGAAMWVITKAATKYKHIDNIGNILSLEMSLSLSAYNGR